MFTISIIGYIKEGKGGIRNEWEDHSYKKLFVKNSLLITGKYGNLFGRMALSVLDISKALSDRVVTWLPPSPLPPDSEVPQECILYSLVRGRTELIMFGGLMKDISLGGQLRDLSQANKPMNDIYY